MELALLLANQHGVHALSHALQLPLSTYYRWNRRRSELVDHRLQADPVTCDLRIHQLLASCRAHGFDVRVKLAGLIPSVVSEPRTRDEPAIAEVGRACGEQGMDTISACPDDGDSFRTRSTESGLVVANPALQLARREIESRFYSRLTCAGLAQMIGMTRFKFIRAFKCAYAVSPYRYLMQVRVRHAKILLGTSHQPLNVIAAAVGFDTQSCLCRAFCRIEGITLARHFHGMRLGTGTGAAFAPMQQTADKTEFRDQHFPRLPADRIASAHYRVGK